MWAIKSFNIYPHTYGPDRIRERFGFFGIEIKLPRRLLVLLVVLCQKECQVVALQSAARET